MKKRKLIRIPRQHIFGNNPDNTSSDEYTRIGDTDIYFKNKEGKTAYLVYLEKTSSSGSTITPGQPSISWKYVIKTYKKITLYEDPEII